MSIQLTALELIPFAGDNTDLVMRNEANTPLLPPRGAAGYRPGDEPVTGLLAPNYEAPAYTLVSHGENGAGAFIVGTNTRISTAGAGNAEIENSDDGGAPDREFVSQRRVISGGADHFDDIVLWDSQMSLYNVLPNATCEVAQAEVN
jgi:hypothetical protein